ncbi:lysophospholipase [Parvularcula bermudensis HTCC2503]|uniref:Lysophospholipase n=1 Tax=Parvularcula bermudensis (strain ATCC BAA-594 / HTCC2503 / KCTC 12087) TaxID=314260 RepID=E0THT3_PARBH|nr:alpha/beta hydrolase [Parvularcula bermudensis]ADM10226.1 lysophospholipase [Parvularcula bermudensis HTCC2503]
MGDAPLITVPHNPLPEGLSAFFVSSYDGATLRLATLNGPSGPSAPGRRGAILVHPGWAEYIEKYGEVAEELHHRGFDVLLLDPRGQGLSQRVSPGDDRALIDNFDKFTEDFSVAVAEMTARYAPPYHVLAHSMGGLITLLSLLKPSPIAVEKVILSAPLTRLFSGDLTRGVTRGLVSTICRLGFGRRPLAGRSDQAMNFEINRLTHDPIRHERFRQLLLARPDTAAGPPRFAWVRSAFRAMDTLTPAALNRALRHPILVASADADVTVDPRHHRELAVTVPNWHLVRIPHSRHEILMEKDVFRTQFWRAFDDYLPPVPPIDKA